MGFIRDGLGKMGQNVSRITVVGTTEHKMEIQDNPV